MKNRKIVLVLLYIFAFGLLLSCTSADTSTVTIRINLGLQKEKAVSYESSIIDKILNFFETKAFAQSAPTNLTSLVINITGPGMDAISQEYTGEIPSEITVEVAAGDSRLFEVLAYTPSVTFRGIATQDLNAGVTIDIPIGMGLYETKIIIPDYGNNRIVQVNPDFSSTSWIEKDATGLNTPSTISINTLYPYDIDFDNEGRIYIANYNFSTEAAIIRIDDINDTTPENLTSTTGILALTIDRINNYLYFATSNAIYRMRTDITDTPVDIGVDNTELGDGNLGISGIAVDNNSLYIANQMASTVRRLDLNLSYPNRAVDYYSGTYNISLGDIIVKSNSVYFTEYGSGVVVSTDLNLVENSILQYAPEESDTFADYGPRLFLAILNNRFYLIDEDGSGTVNRIISFDDFNTDWDVYTGDDNFRFYVC